MRRRVNQRADLRRSARLAVGLLVLVVACGRGEPPRLEVSPLAESPQAGVRSSTVEVRYRLRNVGGRVLALDGVALACGCAATTRLPESLSPGASSELAVRCARPRPGGDVVRELHLRSSDPGSPDTVIRLSLAGERAGPDPSAIYFGYVPIGESMSREVALPVALPLDRVVAPSEGEFTLETMPARADAVYGVRVRFTPRSPGVLRATIDLGPAGALPVIGVGYADVLAFPAELRVSSATGVGVPAITVMGLGDEPLAITAVDYPAGLAGELRTVVPGRQFRLVLRGRADAEGTAAIRLRGERGGDPILTIPVVGTQSGVGPASNS